MSVYLVALVKIKDPAKYADYAKRLMAVLHQYDGELLAADDSPRTLEGHWPYSRTVLLRFVDEAALRRWYDSKEYQAILRHRLEAATADISIVSGLH